MSASGKPWWQQATAVVTVSAGGMLAGMSFVPGTAADLTSPVSLPVHLLALEQSGQPSQTGHASDAMLRSTIVNVAQYYRRLAETKTPAEMESLIWQHASTDGVDHGQSCAARCTRARSLPQGGGENT
jgi:hypothetical protein